MRICLFILSMLVCPLMHAQKLYGTVFNSRGDLLPFASITVKGSTKGASANNKGNYSFSLEPGEYVIVCQHIGYAASEKKIKVLEDIELSFVLSEQKLTMKEVVIKNGGEDPAYGIIRNAIKKRSYYLKQVKGFSCDLYGKDIIKLRNLPKKIMGKKIPDEDRKEMGLDSSGKGIVYLSESVSKVFVQEPGKFKMEVLSSRVSGSGSFGFTFPSFISLYNSNVTVFTEKLNPRGFVSPIAEGAIGFYKFKYLGSFWESGQEINSIRVTPRRFYEPLFTGIINISENDWRIHSFDLLLTKTAQLELLDTLRISQLHVPVTTDSWRVKNQLLHFNFKQFGIDAIGDFLTVYSNYALNPVFDKKTFDRTVIRYDTAVNKRTKEYWDSIRPVPLAPEETRDYKVKDSIYELRKDSAYTRTMVDSLNKKQGKLKLHTLLWRPLDRTYYTRKNQYRWGIEPLLMRAEYNAVEGIVMNVDAYYSSYSKSLRSRVDIEPSVRYGFHNQHLNPRLSLAFTSQEAGASRRSRATWRFSGGKRVTEFNKESTIKPLINSVGILLYGHNYIKTYENYFGEASFLRGYESGLRFKISALFEDRIPIDNTTKFTLYKKDSINITPNYPDEKLAAQFPKHQALVLSAQLSWRPGQRYIQLPYSRIPIGSKYPTFTLQYSKGLDQLLGSDVQFDKWRFTVHDDRNLKLAGTFKYRVGVGGFISAKKTFIQDYQHFNGNQTRAASDYLNSFQLAKYYANSTIASLYSFGHVEHHFNGLLTNKIPLFRKLNWNLVGGANAFAVSADNNYVEAFVGLENILKVFRVDVVVAFENGTKGITGIRVGHGGVLGGSMRLSRSRGDVNVSF